MYELLNWCSGFNDKCALIPQFVLLIMVFFFLAHGGCFSGLSPAWNKRKDEEQKQKHLCVLFCFYEQQNLYSVKYKPACSKQDGAGLSGI